jgi:hypothetical protein
VRGLTVGRTGGGKGQQAVDCALFGCSSLCGFVHQGGSSNIRCSQSSVVDTNEQGRDGVESRVAVTVLTLTHTLIGW